MTRNQSLVFKLILFLFGAFIVYLAFRIFGRDYLSNIDKFMWVSIGLMYLVFFCPFFFSSISIGRFSGKIPSLTMVWLGIFIYVFASIGVIVLLKNDTVSFNTALILQAVLLFFFGLDIFFGYFASSHVGKVAAEEAKKTGYIEALKERSNLLVIKANQLTPEYGSVQIMLKQVKDDIRYLSPANWGLDLEQKILSSLAAISELCDTVVNGGNSPALEEETKKLQILVKERKLLRN